MRIASLVPSATEALFALGFGDDVVAVTHECDWPEAANELPRLTRSVIEPGLPPAAIDAAVRDLTGRGEAIYELDRRVLERLRPDLIVSQAVCAVCAVSYDEVCSVADSLPGDPDVISLDPETLGDVLADLPRLAAACGEPERGDRLRDALVARIDRVRTAVRGRPRPRVLALEWLDPPYVGGHWVPEMIAAGGGMDPIGEAGAKSRVASWDELRAAAPDVVIAMPCGLYADEAADQARAFADQLGALAASRAIAVDAASSFSRPGPRLADGVELLGHLLHPDAVPAPDGLAWQRLTLAEPGRDALGGGDHAAHHGDHPERDQPAPLQ
jgi:iron complex transport system substrate-binding protein